MTIQGGISPQKLFNDIWNKKKDAIDLKFKTSDIQFLKNVKISKFSTNKKLLTKYMNRNTVEVNKHLLNIFI